MTTEVLPQSDESQVAVEAEAVAAGEGAGDVVVDEIVVSEGVDSHTAEEPAASPESQVEESPVVESSEADTDATPKKKKAATPRTAKPKVAKIPKEPKPKAEKKTAPKKTGVGRGRKSKDDDLPPPTVIECTGKREWFILKVQVNRETSIRDALMRRVAMAGMGALFGEVVIPTEKVTEIRGDKKKVVERKLYPGYIMISVELTEEAWFLIRETFGVSDFTTSGGKPSPMLPHEVEKMLVSTKETPEQPKLRVGYQIGDQIKVKDGTFETCEGTVENIDYASGRVTVIISLFGRSTPVELEYWQIEAIG